MLGTRLQGSPRWELAIPLGILFWRLATESPSEYWKDWMLLASLFWIYTVFQSKSTSWPVVTVTVMAYLLGIYLLGQVPHALAVLGIGV
jgi:hypothetical protein